MDNFKGKKVVLLEYSTSSLQSIVNAFEKESIEIRSSNSAIEGIKIIHRFSPDLIILDSVLQDYSGVEVLEYVKKCECFSKTPVIIYSVVNNPFSRSFFSAADLILKKDNNLVVKLLQESKKMLQKNIPNSNELSEIDDIEVLARMDASYCSMATRNEILTELFKLSAASSFDKMVLLFMQFLLNYFSIAVVYLLFNDKNNIHILKKKGHNYQISGSENLKTDVLKRFVKENAIGSLSDYKIIENKFSRNSSDDVSIDCQLKYCNFDFVDRKAGAACYHFIDDVEELANLEFVVSIMSVMLEQADRYSFNIAREKTMRYLFGKFLPQKVINDLLKKNDDESLKTGEKREIAVIFSHIKNFSFIEENNSAEDLVEFLNNHFDGLSKNITAEGGEIDKFIGDAIFAMFGAPESYEDNESRAGKAAVKMIEQVKNNCPNNVKFDESGYKIGVGIHIGKAIIGNIGSDDNFDYTAIGDTINLAARLESLCKYYEVDILVSTNIKKGCYNTGCNLYFREVDTVIVKGKDEPTTIFSLEDKDAFSLDFLDFYSKGLKMFKLGNWFFAQDYFEKCNKLAPNDRIIAIYLERCDKFIKTPPSNWQGAIVLDFK